MMCIRPTIMEDQFIREHIEELLRNIRQQVLIKLIRPYTRVRIDFLSGVRHESMYPLTSIVLSYPITLLLVHLSI